MSSLRAHEKKLFEQLFGMASGYVMDFTNVTFAEFFREHGIEIYSNKYAFNGDSKAKRLRAFWEVEENEIVAEVLSSLLEYWRSTFLGKATPEEVQLAEKCEEVIRGLEPQHISLGDLKTFAVQFNAQYLEDQIRRMEQAVSKDPPLAIGTAKEVIETCCRTILSERGKQVSRGIAFPDLVKEVRKELDAQLVPQELPDTAKGREVVRRMLNNMTSILQGIDELRDLYGTGHGKEASTPRVSPRLAKLAIGLAATLANFLFETHKEKEA